MKLRLISDAEDFVRDVHVPKPYIINSYMKSRLITNAEDNILFTWCRLSLEILINSPINSLNGINIVTESPYGTTLVNVKRPAVPRIYYGKDVGRQGRMTYGVLPGYHAVGSDVNNFVTKPFNYHLHRMSDYLHDLLLDKRFELDLETIDLSYPFNHCTKLLYYAGINLKNSSSMGYHCDITYNHSGIYVKTKNGQAKNTVTVIVIIGDSRNLHWQRQILSRSEKGHKKWVTDPSFKCVVSLGNISILIVNPLDEIASLDDDLGLIVRYRHGGVKVTGSQLSIGFVFRVVTPVAKYDSNNVMITKSNESSRKNENILEKVDIMMFHRELKKLYNATFNKK